jgi:hypothetical protein
MICGLQDKNYAIYIFVTYVYRMHIQDGGMHAAFDQNISRFIKPRKIRNNCKEALYIILNFLSNKTNLI